MPRKAKISSPKIAGPPWFSCQTWEPADASAIQALFRGDANEAQQKRAIQFIVNDLCALQYWPFDPESQRNTDMALGKHNVAHAIVRLSRLNVSQFTKETTE